MEWRQQTSLSCTDAFVEAQRWIEEVTGKSFDCIDFRAALENGVLLSDLINQLKPGIIKRVNRLSTPIAGLDNVSVFLKACGKLGLNESQLFHPGDLQDLSSRVTLKRDEGNRRLKNVLITIYWLGRKANQDGLYKGPQLNFKSFEGLLGLALSRSLDDGSNYCPEKDDAQPKTPNYKRYSSVDSAISPDGKAHATNGEGCGSDAEAEQVFKMETSHVLAQSNKGYLPLLQKVKQAQGGRGCASPLSRSKSLSDIPMVYPVRKMSDETRQSGPTHFKRKSSTTKDTEAQWQDDLTKWKNRRKSSKSDVRRTSVDREHVTNQMTNSANFQKAMSQSGPIKRDQPSQHSPGSHPYSISPTKPSKSNLRPHSRVLLARSNATEMPYNTSSYDSQAHIQGLPGPEMNVLKKDSYVASLASVGVTATTPSVEFTYSSQSHVKNSPGPTQPSSQDVTEDIFTCSSVLPKEMSTLNAAAESLSLVNHTEIDAVNDLTVISPHCEKQELSMETSKGQGFDKYLSRSGTWSGSASLPRGYRRSEGTSRLSSAITARPFGSKPSRVSSLPRLCNVEDNHQNLLSSNDKDVSPPITTLLKRQMPSAHLKGHPPLKHTELGAKQEKENCAILSNVLQTNGFHPEPLIQTQLCTAKMPQLHNSSTLGKEPSGPMHEDHSDMRLCLTLKPNSRRDFGFQTHWDSRGARVTSIQPGSPAELGHLCINDEIIAVDGVTVTKLNFNQWKNKMSSALQTGSLTMDVRRYGNRGGSESAISDLQVPSLSPSSCSWSWDREEERRRQEKWQEEQERLLQEKYQRDQERLEAEWRKAQEDASSDNKEELKMMSSGENHQRVYPHVNGVTSKRPDEQCRATDAVKENSPCGAKEMLLGKTSDDWAHGSCGFAPLSAAHRAKSMSTPALMSPQKLMKGAGDQRKRKSQTPVSKVEQERQQILDEMKKRTQLLTDNSWIRQRSASFYKEPVMPGVPIKRYESMDNLESWRHSPVTSMTFTYPRAQSAAAGYCGSTKISSSRHSTGSMPPTYRTSAWAVTEISEEQRLESKSGSKTAGPTVSPATPNSSTLPSCDQNPALHITE